MRSHYLKGLRDESAVLVSGFHIAEHIPFPDLEVLVQEALRVLKPAGLLVLETPNPENIVVGTSGFYLDPTHTRPLPPRLLSFLTEHCGFERTRILRLHEPAGLAQAAAASLLDVLGGVSPDYAVVAQKRAGTAEHCRLFDPAFSGESGLELETLAVRYDKGMLGRLSEIIQRADRSAASEASTHAAAKERVQAQLEIAAREADLSATQQQIAATQRQLSATQRQLSATQQQLSVLLASPSWRLTGPLRSIAAAARDLRGVPARAVLKFKTWAKPGMIRFGGYISARPALKSGLLRAVKLFPWLHGRMAQAVRPGLAAATPGWDTGSAGARRVDDLAASARRVYQDLLDARNAEAGSRRVDLCPGERIDA